MNVRLGLIYWIVMVSFDTLDSQLVLMQKIV